MTFIPKTPPVRGVFFLCGIMEAQSYLQGQLATNGYYVEVLAFRELPMKPIAPDNGRGKGYGNFLWYNISTAERLSRLTYDVVREARRSSHPEMASATQNLIGASRLDAGWSFLWYNCSVGVVAHLERW